MTPAKKKQPPKKHAAEHKPAPPAHRAVPRISRPKPDPEPDEEFEEVIERKPRRISEKISGEISEEISPEISDEDEEEAPPDFEGLKPNDILRRATNI